MHGHTVDAGRIDHHGQRACKGSGFEGFEVFLTQHLRRDVSWSAVFARPGSTVGKVVFGACGYIVGPQMVGVVTLIAFDFGFHHAGVHYRVFTEALIDTWPAWVTPQVDNGIVNPRAVGGAAFVGRNLSPTQSQLGIERSREVDRLWKERSLLGVGDAVVVVESVYVGYTQVLH